MFLQAFYTLQYHRRLTNAARFTVKGDFCIQQIWQWLKGCREKNFINFVSIEFAFSPFLDSYLSPAMSSTFLASVCIFALVNSFSIQSKREQDFQFVDTIISFSLFLHHRLIYLKHLADWIFLFAVIPLQWKLSSNDWKGKKSMKRKRAWERFQCKTEAFWEFRAEQKQKSCGVVIAIFNASHFILSISFGWTESRRLSLAVTSMECWQIFDEMS